MDCEKHDYGKSLERALELINGQRLSDYGKPEHNFASIANLWNAYLECKEFRSEKLEDYDVAIMMALMKIARLARGKETRKDSFDDLAGYVGLAADLYFREWSKK